MESKLIQTKRTKIALMIETLLPTEINKKFNKNDLIQRGSFLDHLQIQYPTKIIKKLNNFATSLSKLISSNGYLNNKKESKRIQNKELK